MSKHTPGPWTLRKNSRGEECGAVLGADGMLVATTGYRASPLNDEDDANARLIAAAPELLDGCNALLGLLQLIEGRCDAELLEVIRTNHRVGEARAAIARATGAQA